jgi:type II secretory pathway pseudopilin PulG
MGRRTKNEDQRPSPAVSVLRTSDQVCSPFSNLRSSPGREDGYTLVIVVLTVAIMSIMMTVAVQTVEFQMRREREAELIFRGEQYVEAIRLFKSKYGRHPMRLQEIWEADPRVIRKKFKDPITDSEDWGLIFVGQEGRRIGPENAFPGTPMPTRTETFGKGGLVGDSPFETRDREGQKIGPIAGVHSKSCDESIKIYEGRTTYCEWQFVLREKGRGRGTASGPISAN